VHELFAQAQRDGAAQALNAALRERGRLPGFGHSVYGGGDPRCGVLFDRAQPVVDAERAEVVREVASLAAEHELPPPNSDFALATLTWGTGMASDAGRALFAVARTVGWAAHYLEELSEPPLRFRARAVYSA
jgi:citrate synthase